MDPAAPWQSLGLTLPSPAYLVGALVFGLLGLAAYRYGRKAELPRTKWLGVVLMLYAYFTSQTWLLYVVGVTLCAGIYWDQR